MECLLQLLKKRHLWLARDIHTSTYLKTSIILVWNKLEDYLGKTNQSAVWRAFFVFNTNHKLDSIQVLWDKNSK